MNLRDVLFWDTDPQKIDKEKHSIYIIERVARYGNLDEWNSVLSFYGEKRIKKEIVRIRDLDKKTLNYLSIRFNIPKENFKCYTEHQSTQTPFHS